MGYKTGEGSIEVKQRQHNLLYPPPLDEESNVELERLLLKQRLAGKFGQNTLSTIRDIETQLEILTAFDGCNFEDVTENQNLQSHIKNGEQTHPLFLGGEGAFRAGRVYAPKAPMAKSIIKTEELLYDIRADDLLLTTNFHECSLKKVVEVCIVFWDDINRTARETTGSKIIYLFESQVKNEPNRGPQAVAWTNVQVATSTQTAADYQKSLTDYFLPMGHEFTISIPQVNFDCWVDAWITVLTE